MHLFYFAREEKGAGVKYKAEREERALQGKDIGRPVVEGFAHGG